jgi:hypothetical protein
MAQRDTREVLWKTAKPQAWIQSVYRRTARRLTSELRLLRTDVRPTLLRRLDHFRRTNDRFATLLPEAAEGTALQIQEDGVTFLHVP